MGIRGTVLFLFSFLFLFVTGVAADEVKVEPQISKFNTDVIFDEEKEFDSRELIIKFKPGVSTEEKGRILQSVKVKELSNLDNFTLGSAAKGDDLKSIAENLLKYKQIEYVEPNYQIEPHFTPGDPGYSKQWYLKKIQMPKAWDTTKGASNITVAVIDAGVQTNHPELKGKIVSPYDVTRGSTSVSPDDHGTHVAGIIAATINKSGISGIAPNVKIMPVDVFAGDGANVYDVAEGIMYAVDHKADILNLSLGSYYYSYPLEYAVSYAKSKGVLVVAAAGNDDSSEYTYPAALPSVLGVSATDSLDRITQFSNYGDYIDFAAPGMDIYSTISGSKYASLDGTSMASPVVSGVSALVLSKNPFLSPSQVQNILIKSSSDLGSKGWDYLYGYGRVDAYKAMTNTPTPLHSLKLSSSTFTMKGSNKNNISFYAQNGTAVSLYIQNSKGTTLKKLLVNKKWSGGKVTVSWDGRMDNGAYVTSGTYKVLAKATNGKKTVYKSTTLKTIDKVTPSIQVASSIFYSPPVRGKLVVPYHLNKSAKVTATIYDRNNKLVKKILNNSSISSGKRSLVWDGKTSKGKKVSDGKYTLIMSVIDSRKVKGTTRRTAINVDSIKPAGKATLYSSTLKMDGKSKPVLKMDFKEAVHLNAYVTTDKGTKIKKLAYGKYYKKGVSNIHWDGKNDKGQFASEGKYQIYLEYRDSAGNKATLKSSLFALQDWLKPTVKSLPNLEYRSKTNVPVSYSISKPGYVTVQLIKENTLLRTVQTSTFKTKGSHTFIFDGKDQSGNYLADGAYQFKIVMTDKYKLVNQFIGGIKIALTRVEIEYSPVIFYDPLEERKIDVFYKLSEPAKVTIEIFNEYNDKVKTITTNTQAQIDNSFSWDGIDPNYNEHGSLYFYSIRAVNNVGNETVVKGKLINEENSAWVESITHTFLPDDEYIGRNKQLNLHISLNQPTKLSMKVFDYYSETLLEQKEFTLTQGMNTIEYIKLQSTDQYYLLDFKDHLGNIVYSYYLRD
ncbi:S8 family serine peptidase [Bacillus sp. ISL-35]|uniref:S8 family serine peptidase n=1 Tax=Bacillus sp. ISL-35 TaxID=2819122 RepID=UPI001BE9FD62|nr:S8 family serine peptidase [Bacillus sp. ISL-35]MBT2678802.1 S8 family serine peptidase [Bacillus sp. ISL-35]MBT2703794.1 S8 family serine peptidase [Chryseobacterium sp. ISL-80]